MRRHAIERFDLLARLESRSLSSLDSLAGQVAVPADHVLLFPGLPLGDAVGLQLGIPDEAPKFLDQSAFDLVPYAHDPIGVYSDQLISAPTFRIQRIALGPFSGPIRRELRIADSYSEALHDRPFDLMTDAFDAFPSVPMMMRQATPGSLPLRAEGRNIHGHAPYL